MFRKLQWRMGAAWCRMSHGSLMWPVHGEYQCRTCGRRYPAFPETPRAYQINQAGLKSAVSLLLVAAVVTLAPPARAANVRTGQTTAEAVGLLPPDCRQPAGMAALDRLKKSQKYLRSVFDSATLSADGTGVEISRTRGNNRRYHFDWTVDRR